MRLGQNLLVLIKKKRVFKVQFSSFIMCIPEVKDFPYVCCSRTAIFLSLLFDEKYNVLCWRTAHHLALLPQGTWYHIRNGPEHHQSLQPPHGQLSMHLSAFSPLPFFHTLLGSMMKYYSPSAHQIVVVFPVNYGPVYNGITDCRVARSASFWPLSPAALWTRVR